MKKIILTIVLLFSFGLAVQAQQKAVTKTEQKQKGGLENWQAIKDFHEVMSQTYHPSEEGNLEPIKSRIGEMVEKAYLLETSEIPKDIDTRELHAEIKSLISGSLELQTLIANGGNDADITKALEDLHGVFHNIVGLCVEDH